MTVISEHFFGVSLCDGIQIIDYDAVAKDLIVPYRVAPLATAIGGVALDGVNPYHFQKDVSRTNYKIRQT